LTNTHQSPRGSGGLERTDASRLRPAQQVRSGRASRSLEQRIGQEGLSTLSLMGEKNRSRDMGIPTPEGQTAQMLLSA
jgi:acetylglutamate kinase